MFSLITIKSRKFLSIWQLLFILVGTSWLLAPTLNPALSSRISEVSQYENPGQPYSWLFRICDLIAATLLVFIAIKIIRLRAKKRIGILLLIVGLGFVIDVSIPTSCQVTANQCVEYPSLSFVIHAVESIVTALTLFILSFTDVIKRKKLISIGLVCIQIYYGAITILQLRGYEQYNTISQFVYLTSIFVWLAWFCRDNITEKLFKTGKTEQRAVRFLLAAWIFINGILAIILSLTHLHLLGRVEGLYFANDTAWLAQHAVITGIVMLYLSRHIARGEMRARQIVMAITIIEAIKYSVITPHANLMVLYLLTFSILFVLRDNFDRGTLPVSWAVRIRDVYILISGLLITAVVSLFILDRDDKVSVITSKSFKYFMEYAFSSGSSQRHQTSVLLTHTTTVFIMAGLVAVLWVLFKPFKLKNPPKSDELFFEDSLYNFASSPDDYFKLWPHDKKYFIKDNGFIAYKEYGAIAYTLADPISAHQKTILEAYLAWAKSSRLRACFMLVNNKNLSLYKNAGLETIQVGSSALIKIEHFLDTTSKDKWWRWQKNKAEKSGYTYKKSLPPHSDKFLNQLKTVSDAWLNVGHHTERGFGLGYFNNEYLQRCTVHYLTDYQKAIVAFTNQLPVFKILDTASVDLIRYVPEANNSMPYLLYKTIENIHSEASVMTHFDLGFVPFTGAKGTVMKITKSLSGGRFSTKGLEQFKNKFDPDWQPNYIAYDGDIADLAFITLNLEKVMRVSNEPSQKI